MKRVLVLGRGGAGKSTLATRLGALLDIPVVELDKLFWPPDLTPTPADRWAEIQRDLIAGDRWILDGDLGPYDALDVRLSAADTIVLLDFPFWRCAWRALRRSRENLAFWRWLIGYRRHSLPRILADIAAHGAQADLRVLRSPRAVAHFFTTLPPGLQSGHGDGGGGDGGDGGGGGGGGGGTSSL